MAKKPADYGFEQVPTPSVHVYDVFADHKGFIWVGDGLGLSRYDGLSCTPYHNINQRSLSMCDIAEDSSGRIWCRNFNGQIFYVENDHMKLLEGYGTDVDLSRFVIAGNELLAKSNKGILIHNLKNNKNRIITVACDNTPLGNLSEGIYVYGMEVFLSASLNNKMRVFRYKDGCIKPLKPDLDRQYKMLVYADNKQVIVSNYLNDSLTCFDIRGDRLIRTKAFFLSGSSTYSQSSRAGEQIWISTARQTALLNGNCAIRGMSITNVTKDREGNIWASSPVYGLLLKKRKPNWKLLHLINGSQYVTAFTRWRDKVIAGTSDGKLMIADSAFFLKPENRKVITINSNKPVEGFLPDKDHLRIYGSGVFILDNRLHFFRRFGTYVTNACRMDNAFYILGTSSAMIALPINGPSLKNNFHPASGIISTYFKYDSTSEVFAVKRNGRRVRGVWYDEARKTLYAGFSDGLYAYTADTVKEIRFEQAAIYAYDIVAYKNTQFIATLNTGVLILKGGKIIDQLDPRNGLSAVSVLKLRLFGTHLWILSVDGIQLYDVEKKSFITPVTLPPIKGSQVFDLMELNGNVYFSTQNGIYTTSLRKIKKETLPVNYLLSVIANTTDTIQNGARLSYKKNSLQFNLVGLYYFNAKEIYFAYRLLGSGSDTSWEYSSPGQNKILFPYVMPGTYTFEAVANTPAGLAAAEKIRFSFTINKPWWQQWWFILSMAAFLLGISYLILYLRIQNRKRAHQLVVEKLKYENEANESELKALKSQMNPHFIFNSLNTIQEMFMWGDKNAANEQLSNFAMLTRLILTVSGKKNISLSTEVNILEKYLALEKMRFHDSFSYEIMIDKEIDEDYIQIPPMIIQPFVENSIKHGLLHKKGSKKLSVIFKGMRENEYIVCTVTDNGIGREKAAEYKTRARYSYNSFSIEAIRKRLNLMGRNNAEALTIVYADLKDESGGAAGTSVTVTIPTFIL